MTVLGLALLAVGNRVSWWLALWISVGLAAAFVLFMLAALVASYWMDHRSGSVAPRDSKAF